jgi:hypothetical protein
MKNVIRARKSRAVRPAWWAASAVAVVAAGILAGSGNAAPPDHADKASHTPNETGLNEPHLRHGLLTIRGTEASDEIALRLQAGEPGILEVDFGDDGSADFSFERAEIASIVVKARAGDDLVRIDEGNGTFTDSIPTELAGEAGDDNLAGGSGAETLLGGPGNDSLDGNRANDLAVMGAGDDTFVWDPGDGSDTVDGESGFDTHVFNGAGGNETFEATADGNRVRFSRSPGNIVMNLDDFEALDVNALGGGDSVTINDLAGTGLTDVIVDLGLALGSDFSDGVADTVKVGATAGIDTITASANGGAVDVTGLAASVRIAHTDPALDLLTIDTLAGADDVAVAAAVDALIQVSVQ